MWEDFALILNKHTHKKYKDEGMLTCCCCMTWANLWGSYSGGSEGRYTSCFCRVSSSSHKANTPNNLQTNHQLRTSPLGLVSNSGWRTIKPVIHFNICTIWTVYCFMYSVLCLFASSCNIWISVLSCSVFLFLLTCLRYTDINKHSCLIWHAYGTSDSLTNSVPVK